MQDLAGERSRRAGSPIELELEHGEMTDCVQQHLQTLIDDHRIAHLLHDVHGLTNQQIADLLGVSLATAKIRVHRARRRLRDLLAAACVIETDQDAHGGPRAASGP